MSTSTKPPAGPLETRIRLRYKQSTDALEHLREAYRLIEAARIRHEQGVDSTRARV